MVYAPEFHWNASLAFGDSAAADVARALQRTGHTVVDISQLKDSQRRGIDLLVDGEYCDVKSDRHTAHSVFFETTCDGQPGCFWKSRADYWLYWYPRDRKLYRINLPRAQQFLAEHYNEWPEKTIRSRSRDRTWSAVGLVVPLEPMLAEGIAVDVSYLMDEDAA